MRVLHVVANGDPGWAATAALALIEAIPQARGVRHAMVTETGSPLAAASRARGVPTATRAFQRTRRFGQLRPRLVETVWEIAPDVVHAHGISAAFAVLPALEWLGLPMVLSMPAVAPPRLDWTKRMFQRLQRRTAVAGAAVLLFGTQAEMAAARADRRIPMGCRAMMAPPPLDLDALPSRAAGQGEAAPGILLQGRIHRDFACGRVVAALSAAPAAARLCVLGDGEGVPLLANALEQAGLAARIDWPGPLPRHEALNRLAGAALVLDPRPGPGVPIGLIEAAALGVPVLAEARPALAEALGISGIDATAGDQVWGEACAPLLATQLHQAARTHVRHWLSHARAVEQHLRAWEVAAAAVQELIAGDLPAGLPDAGGLATASEARAVASARVAAVEGLGRPA